MKQYNCAVIAYVLAATMLLAQTPVPGDYDGDGVVEPAVYQSGVWHIGTNAPLEWGKGLQDPVPMPADYNGDGRTDLGIVERAGWLWFVRDARPDCPPIVWGLQWGYGACQPAALDVDGDGAADLTVYDHAGRVWYSVGIDGAARWWERRQGPPEPQIVPRVIVGGDGPGRFIYKPVSESDGRLAVLAAENLPADIHTCVMARDTEGADVLPDGVGTEVKPYTGHEGTSAPRRTWRFRVPGSAFGLNVYCVFAGPGNIWAYCVPDGGKRVD